MAFRAKWRRDIEEQEQQARAQKRVVPEVIDFEVQNHGSLFILIANTADAEEWVEQHLPEDRLTWGVNGTVVEHRYIADIVQGIQGDGLVVR